MLHYTVSSVKLGYISVFENNPLFLGILVTLLCAVVKFGESNIGEWYIITLIAVIAFLMVITLLSIARQPRSVLEPNFTTPLTPWLPGVSILINFYLMFQLDQGTWIRFAIWMVVGLVIYFGYGIFHSHERESVKAKLLLNAQAAEATTKVAEIESKAVEAETKQSI